MYEWCVRQFQFVCCGSKAVRVRQQLEVLTTLTSSACPPYIPVLECPRKPIWVSFYVEILLGVESCSSILRLPPRRTVVIFFVCSPDPAEAPVQFFYRMFSWQCRITYCLALFIQTGSIILHISCTAPLHFILKKRLFKLHKTAISKSFLLNTHCPFDFKLRTLYNCHDDLPKFTNSSHSNNFAHVQWWHLVLWLVN